MKTRSVFFVYLFFNGSMPELYIRELTVMVINKYLCALTISHQAIMIYWYTDIYISYLLYIFFCCALDLSVIYRCVYFTWVSFTNFTNLAYCEVVFFCHLQCTFYIRKINRLKCVIFYVVLKMFSEKTLMCYTLWYMYLQIHMRKTNVLYNMIFGNCECKVKRMLEFQLSLLLNFLISVFEFHEPLHWPLQRENQTAYGPNQYQPLFGGPVPPVPSPVSSHH